MTYYNLTKLAASAVDPKIMRNAYIRIQRIKDYAKANPDTTSVIPQSGGQFGLTAARAHLKRLQDLDMPYQRTPGSLRKK